MALVPMSLTRLWLDTVSGEVVAEAAEAVVDGHPDPANFTPEMTVRFRLPVTRNSASYSERGDKDKPVDPVALVEGQKTRPGRV